MTDWIEEWFGEASVFPYPNREDEATAISLLIGDYTGAPHGARVPRAIVIATSR